MVQESQLTMTKKFRIKELWGAGDLVLPQRPPVIIGIDPDSNGALAVVHVDAYPNPGAQVIEDVVVQLHDNPCEVLQATKQRKRRYISTSNLLLIMLHYT